jgi:hypothetical protein
MTTIEKKVEIPENRRLYLELELPENVPAGEANIQVIISSNQNKCLTLRDLNKFKGLLKDSPVFKGDGVDIQRKMRDE